LIAKIGLLGGTFDPVHAGHVQLAEMAMAEEGLDKVQFIQAASPPHKRDAAITSYRHRLAMLRLALAGYDRFGVSLAESILPLPSYTIDTINYLQSNYPVDTRLYFIIGLDAFLEIGSWKSFRELLSRVHLLVARRDIMDSEDQLRVLAGHLRYTFTGTVWHGLDRQKDITFMRGRPLSISSSTIRQAVRNGDQTYQGIADPVRRYINEHHLYTEK
jgi:nicotinate-nucleotide adenylyltransferase